MISYRSAIGADKPIIRRLVRGEALNPMGLNWQNFTLALADDKRVVGCVQLKSHRGCQELASLVVVKSWRGQGVARMLVEKVKADAGIPLYLMCAGNLAPFYEQFGFVVVTERGEMPAFFRRISWFVTLMQKTKLVNWQLAIMAWV